jgi:hypothetical protein
MALESLKCGREPLFDVFFLLSFVDTFEKIVRYS